MESERTDPDLFEYLTGNSTGQETSGNYFNLLIIIKICQLKKKREILDILFLFFVFSDSDLPVDCSELFNKGEANNGIYVIKPNQSEPFYAYCEMGQGKQNLNNLSSQPEQIIILSYFI